jgi:hypothetical protein
VLAGFFLSFATGLMAQSSGCSLPQPSLTTSRKNFFNEQQEQWLGDAMAAQQESGFNLLPASESEQLTAIGQKLLAQLPPTPIHYKFQVYDSEEFNAFSIAGGYIYVSRKLIIDAHSEDELAGVLAHEIGHIYTHQIATTVTRQMEKMMHVTSVSDQGDIADKYQRLMNATWKERSDLAPDEAEKDELHADAVGLYALARAGYAPMAMPNDLERVGSLGKNGNILSDILGGSSEAGIRVRAARKAASQTTDNCRAMVEHSSPEFQKFQQALIARPANTLLPPTAGLNSIALSEPVRPGLNRIRFSQDGKYLLAQNETYIHILSVSPLKHLFQVYAPGASAAQFSPDSKHLVFHYQSLRVENWDVETGKMSSARELIEYQGCWQSELSPDGRLLACILRNREDLQLSLEIFDVLSGKIVWSKADAFVPDTRAEEYRAMTRTGWDPDVLAMAFSPDARYMIVAGQASNLALDLQDLKVVKMKMALSGLVQGRLLFITPTQVMYDCDAGQDQIFRKAQSNVCLAEFPTGVTQGKFVEGWESMLPMTQGNYVLAGTLFDSIPHLVDLRTGKPASPIRFAAADVYGKLMASESSKGGLTVGEIGSAKVDVVDLPAMPLPYVRVARFSPDGRYLALSNENHGAIWDLAKNHQIALTRGFRGAWFDGDGQLFLQMPAGQIKLGQNICLNLKTGVVSETGKYERDVLQEMDVRMDRDWQDVQKLDGKELHVYDGKTGNLLWSKKYSKDAPVITEQEPGILTFFWGMEGETAWDEVGHSSVLTRTADENHEEHQGSLTELVDSHTGSVLRQVMSPEGSLNGWGTDPHSYSSGRDKRFAEVYGNVVAVHGNQHNTVVYDLTSGAKLMSFWGRVIAGDSHLGWLAVKNHDQEVIVYDVHTGKKLTHATVDHVVTTAQFVAEKKQLLVLTNNQQVYTLEIGTLPLDMQTVAAPHP